MPRSTSKIRPPVGLRAWTGPVARMASAHHHHDLEVNYVLAGEVRYVVGGAVVTLNPGRFTLLWAAMPHQLLDPQPDARMFWVCVPLTKALLWSLPESFTTQLFTRGVVIDPRPRKTDRSLLEQWHDDLARNDAGRRALVLREIEARLHRLAVDVSESAHAGGPSPEVFAPPATTGAFKSAGSLAVQQMAQFIAEHHHEPINVDAVAHVASLHPNYAMSLFRRQTGMTINEFLTRQRIAHAQRLLATTPQPILAIAYASGFGSPSRFFEAFKQYAGCSPRKFRQRLVPDGRAGVADV